MVAGDRADDADRQQDAAEDGAGEMRLGQPAFRVGGLRAVIEPEEEVRHPADEVDVGVDGREGEVLRHAHEGAERHAGQREEHPGDEETVGERHALIPGA